MKTILSGLCLAFAAITLQAQEVVIQTDEAPVVYESPVVYQSEATYNAPVVYNAPVFYVSTATTPASVAYTASSTASCVYQPAHQSAGMTTCEAASPNVIIVGRGAYHTSYQETPNVIIIPDHNASRGNLSTRGYSRHCR